MHNWSKLQALQTTVSLLPFWILANLILVSGTTNKTPEKCLFSPLENLNLGPNLSSWRCSHNKRVWMHVTLWVVDRRPHSGLFRSQVFTRYWQDSGHDNELWVISRFRSGNYRCFMINSWPLKLFIFGLHTWAWVYILHPKIFLFLLCRL